MMKTGMLSFENGDHADRDRPLAGRAFDEAIRRAKADFLEMPGLRLTAAQAMRLWAFDAGLCAAVLGRLVETGFLVPMRNLSFGRPE
jgi:hypothetical protein